MRKLGVVAVVIIGGALICSAWMLRDQDAGARRDQPSITVSYAQDSGIAWVWEWKGTEIIARTTYATGEKGVLTKQRMNVAEEKK